MARRATSLGPKPSLFVFCFFFFSVFCFGGFKGQVRWPNAPHLALNPPYLFVVLSLFSFLSLLFNSKNLVFSLEKGIFCLFLSVSLCFSLALPLFQFLFLCLSLPLFFLSSFLSFFFAFFCFLVFVSLFPFLLCFCFMKRTTSKYSITKLFFINIFSRLGFLYWFLFEIPFSYLCFFSSI